MTEIEKQIKECLPKIKRYILSRVSDCHYAEEILQETLLAASLSYPNFKGNSSFFTWLCGIANHEIADFYRRKKIKTILFSHFPFLEDLASQALAPDEDFEKQELRKEVKHILSCLSEGYGKILRLKYYHGMSMVEIAHELKTTVKAVESKLSRAREAFRKQWSCTTRHSDQTKCVEESLSFVEKGISRLRSR